MANVLGKREISRFCSQLQLLLNAGVPLLEALTIIAHLTKNQIYIAMSEKLSEGESLAEAMAAYFPVMVKGSIENAERAGNLEEGLGRLSAYYKHQVEVEEKIKSALLYPGLIITLCVFSLLVLILFVIPDFSNMFRELGINLPFITSFLIVCFEYLANYGLIYLALISGLLMVFIKYFKTEKGRALLDVICMKIRFFGEGQVLQMIRSLGSLLQGGIPIDRALNLVANNTDNRVIKNIMVDLKKSVENGSELNSALSRSHYFSTQIVNMVALGEKSGRLAEMLSSAADFCEMERELFVKRLITLFEPAMTIMVGLVVAVVALAMFLPMINMISSLQ